MKDINKIVEFLGDQKDHLMLVVSIFILVVMVKNPYINCKKIITKHMECLKNDKGKFDKISILIFFVLPLIMSCILAHQCNIDQDIIDVLTVIISILTSMFFTVLTLILDMRKGVIRDKEYDASSANAIAKILKETYYTIMFEIFISILILIMCLVYSFGKIYGAINSGIIYYLSLLLIFNLFIVLKRIFLVIDEEMEKDEK